MNGQDKSAKNKTKTNEWMNKWKMKWHKTTWNINEINDMKLKLNETNEGVNERMNEWL